MRKLQLLFIASLLTFNLFGQNQTLRKLFFEAQNESGKKVFYNYCVNLPSKDNLQLAYSGVAAAMYAEVVSSVSDKLQFFNTGKSIIEKCIGRDSYNAEIRFLRFSVQDKAPKMLGYSGNMQEDADVIYNAIARGYVNKSDNYWSTVIKFILESGLSDTAKNKFKKL
ncbi:MAG: hypothetical protein ACKO8Q_08255 [Bacteroidota bacterium]|jgi:hypothetical protein